MYNIIALLLSGFSHWAWL